MTSTTDAGKQIYEKMVARGLTVSGLAEASGIERYTLSHIVRGNVQPDQEQAARIEKALSPSGIAPTY